MSQTMKQGRLPFGLPRVVGPRTSSAYAAFHRPAAPRPQRRDATGHAAQAKEIESAMAVLQE